MVTNKELSLTLKSKFVSGSLLDKWKIIYRPYICPFNYILEATEKNKKNFDIGCGSGTFLFLLSKFRSPKKIGGVEISEKLIETSKNLLHGMHINNSLSVYDGEHLPDNLIEYDNIYLIDVFHHIPPEKQIGFIENIYNKMAYGAKLFFKDIDRGSPLVYMNKLHDLVISKEVGKEISFEDAQILLGKTQFKICEAVKLRTLWYPHYLIICQK